MIPSFRGLQNELDKGTTGPLRSAGAKGGVLFGDAAGKSAGSRFGTVFKNAAKASLVGLAGAGALAFKVGADSVQQASELGESLNAVNVTYGKQSRAVKKLGRESAKSLGLSNSEFNGLAVQFSAFAKTVGGNKKVASTLDDLTTRAADFASVMNLDVAESAGLFQSGLAGETEPLRKFGIDLSAAAVNAFAYSNGIAKAGEDLTESEKVQARYASLMEQTSKTQGDFANTSDSLANRQRILNARWDDARAKLGKGLLPVVEDLVDVILEDGIPAFERFSDFIVEDGIPAFKDAAKFAQRAGEKVGDLVGFLKDLPDPAKYAGLAALLGGGTALKLRGGGGGALGAAGQALGLAKPINVFVTNPGFSKGGTSAATTDGRGKGGKGGAVALLLGSLFGPQIIDELKAEAMYPFTDGPFKPKDGKSSDADRTQALRDFYTAGDKADQVAKRLGVTTDANVGKFESFYTATGRAKRSLDGIKGAGDKINATPIKPRVDTTDVERALALLNTLKGLAGRDDFGDRGFSGGDGGNSAVTPLPPGNGRTAGVNFNGPINIQAHDYDDFTSKIQKKSQRAGLGGRP